MNTPITFKIAKLLKEKGYDILCLKCYLEDGSIQISSGDEGDFNEYNHNQWDNYSAPTITEVVMWLYEKHDIWISVFSSDDVIMFSYKICSNQGSYYSPYFNSPKAAYEAAIEYTLNNLI